MIQDLCPAFSRHLFAISSVSGGSIGAAVFAGLTQTIKNDPSRPDLKCVQSGAVAGGLYYTDVAEDILRDDFLSPVLAAFLFPDFLQRFLFFPIPQFDRSIALEKSLETSWDERTFEYRARFPDRWVDASNPLREPFIRQWDPRGDSPALFINTTEMESGRGRIIAPLSMEAVEFSSLPLIHIPTGAGGNPVGIDLPMSTAAVLSARFPWLTPPGSFLASITSQGGTLQQREIHLVDGGYLDNSGIVTALAIIREIKQAIVELNPKLAVQLHLIVLTSGGFADPPMVLGDYFAPFQTLLNTRRARGAIAVEEAERQVAEGWAEARLQGHGYPLPLGWRLSPITRLLILGQNGDARYCQEGIEGIKRQYSPDCLKADIYADLSK
jgi:hypothetical protein